MYALEKKGFKNLQVQVMIGPVFWVDCFYFILLAYWGI